MIALARYAGAGDTAATARLLRLVAPEMMRVVRGVMGPYLADVDDAAQQAMVGLVHALPAFRGDCSALGYACRIAFRTALSVRRSVRRQRARCDASIDADTLSQEGPFDSETARRTALVRTLLDEIPPEQAEALALRTMLGWSLEEIAQASAVPVNTVRSRLRLAKESLKRRIEASPGLLEALGMQS